MAMTLYQLLGVASNAGIDEIKAAYVRKAAQLRSPGAKNSAALNALKQAFEVLSDASMRARYDKAPYQVAESDSDGTSASSELFTPRNVGVLVLLLAVAFVGTVGFQRYERNERIKQEQVEAKRLADEEQRKQEELDRAEERRLAQERRQEEIARQQLNNATYQSTRESANRAATERSLAIREQELELRRQREAQYREQAEQNRRQREAQMQLEREKRLLREMQGNHPRKF